MKKLLALLLTLCLVIGMVPLAASAAGEDDSGDAQQPAAQKLAEALGTGNATVEGNTVTLTKMLVLQRALPLRGSLSSIWLARLSAPLAAGCLKAATISWLL